MDIANIILLIPIALLSVSFHEYMHGRVSHMLGDPTPEAMGRLTMNPLAHLDIFGTLAIILIHVGWAKPVPVNPRYYKNPRKGLMYVGMAGPAANIVLALGFVVLFRLLAMYYGVSSSHLLYYSLRGMLSSKPLTMISTMIFMGININLALAIFNLIPVPPLDGSKILRGFLPSSIDKYLYKLEGPIGMLVVIALVYLGFVDKIIFPLVTIIQSYLL